MEKYNHIVTLPFDEVVSKIHDDRDKSKATFIVDGITYNVNVNSSRIQLFKNHRKCVRCGIEGNVFILDHYKTRPHEKPHINLYHKDKENLILMTKDHIIPQSKGGKDILSNLQCMCETCNGRKSDKDDFIDRNENEIRLHISDCIRSVSNKLSANKTIYYEGNKILIKPGYKGTNVEYFYFKGDKNRFKRKIIIPIGLRSSFEDLGNIAFANYLEFKQQFQSTNNLDSEDLGYINDPYFWIDMYNRSKEETVSSDYIMSKITGEWNI